MAKPTQVAVARLLKPHGLRGEIAAKLLTDHPERVAAGASFLLSAPVAEATRVVISSVRFKKDLLLLTLEGVSDRAGAETFSGISLMMPVANLPELEMGSYYHRDLLGMRVVTSEGRNLGHLREILETGANDVYVVRRGSREVLLPAIQSVVKSVDVKSGVMTADPLPGLLPEDSDED